MSLFIVVCTYLCNGVCFVNCMDMVLCNFYLTGLTGFTQNLSETADPAQNLSKTADPAGLLLINNIRQRKQAIALLQCKAEGSLALGWMTLTSGRETNKIHVIVFLCSQLVLVTNSIEEKLTMRKGEHTIFLIHKNGDVFDLFSGYEAVVRTVCGPEL